MGNDLDRQLKLPAHMAHNHQLLIIFFTEYSHLGLHAGKQFQHHGTDTGEEPRPELTLENATQICRRQNLITLRLGVHFFFVRSKQHIHVAFALELFNIGLKRTRIPVKIFIGPELQAVHKNAGNHRIAMLARQFHERQMPLMQVTHGGHK